MSPRVIILLVGVLSSGLAFISRFGRFFEGWDARLLSSLPLPANFGVLPASVEAICVVLFGFGTAIVGVQVAGVKYRVGLLLAILLQPISAVAVGALVGVWISPVASLVAIVAAFIGISAYQFSAAGQRERQLRQIFGKQLSAVSLGQLLPRSDALIPKTTPATVLSARYLGQDWARVEATAAHLRARSAWVEVQTGHRLLAVWNLPLELPDPAEKAVAASLEMGGDWQIGLATGEVEGELSTATQSTQQWQMRGSVFEKADALYQANATFGSRILLDPVTSDLVRQRVILRPVDFLVLPAGELGVEVFEPLALNDSVLSETLAQRDRFWEAVIYFRQKRFAEALAAFQKAGDDAVVEYYRKRLENALKN